MPSPEDKTRIYKIIAVILVFLVLLWAVKAILEPDLFPIRNVQVGSTYQHVTAEQLEKNIEPFAEGGFFTVNVGRLRNHLMQIPWVFDATVTRVWPDTLDVKVVEQRVVARWGNTGLLNSEGVLFYPRLDTFPQELPVLNGPKGDAQFLWRFYRQLNHRLKPINLRVSELNLSDRRAWSLILNNGIKVYLGRLLVKQRFDRFVRAYPKVIGDKANKVSTVDLRYVNGLSIRWN